MIAAGTTGAAGIAGRVGRAAAGLAPGLAEAGRAAAGALAGHAGTIVVRAARAVALATVTGGRLRARRGRASSRARRLRAWHGILQRRAGRATDAAAGVTDAGRVLVAGATAGTTAGRVRNP